jgi:hypothetical protein
MFRIRHRAGRPSENTAEVFTPRSTPITASGRAGVRSVRTTSTVNDTNQRPASYRTVAGPILAVPLSMRRASLRVHRAF